MSDCITGSYDDALYKSTYTLLYLLYTLPHRLTQIWNYQGFCTHRLNISGPNLPCKNRPTVYGDIQNFHVNRFFLSQLRENPTCTQLQNDISKSFPSLDALNDDKVVFTNCHSKRDGQITRNHKQRPLPSRCAKCTMCKLFTFSPFSLKSHSLSVSIMNDVIPQHNVT